MATNRPYFYGLGKRKNSIARVRLFQEGEGKMTVNDMPINKYLHEPLIENALAPLALTELLKKVDIVAFVEGGGKVAQSDAMRLGIRAGAEFIMPTMR